jgi:deoxyribonuclease IV
MMHMAEQTRFGPAGVPPAFWILKAKIADVPALLREEGLDAFEYQAVRWGAKPQMKREEAEKLGEAARKSDVRLSIHGSYFVNLSGKEDVVEASKQRLLAGAIAADWMGAYVMVFHVGFYGRVEKSFAFQNCIKALKEVTEEMKSLGLKVKLGPETMGRKFQVGSLDEILTICQEIENTQLVVDWGHLHARNLGTFKKVDDMREVAVKIEQQLGTQALRNMHCHFSKIEFNSQGERKHHVLEEKRYGPEFGMLSEVLLEFGMHPTMICESPLLDIDAVVMRETLKETIKRKSAQQGPA